MKIAFCIILANLLQTSVFALEVENPISFMVSRTDLSQSEQARLVEIGFKKISIDINGDGKLDMLLCHDDPDDEDATDQQARAQEAGLLWWNVFVKKPDDTAYIANTGPVVDNILGLGFPLAIHPEWIFAGQIEEIDRYGIVSLQYQNPREGPHKTIIWGYTWEGDHLKQHKLAEYETEQKNAIFDKYLAEDKKTFIQVEQVTP